MSRLLTVLGRKPIRYLLADGFAGASGAALSALWTAQLGAFELDGAGHVRGKTLQADGNELISNGEFTTDLTGWVPGGTAAISRVDSTLDPGVASGGADSWVIKVVSAGPGNRQASATTSPGVRGASYRMAARAYVPSANTDVNIAQLIIASGIQAAAISVEDAWQSISGVAILPTSTNLIPAVLAYSVAGDVAYFDSVSLQIMYAIATVNPAVSACEIRVPVTLPASGVTPFGIVARYQDARNYWYWRITPGKASGNDAELIEVNAGVATQRAAARVAWAAGQTYNLTLRHTSGNVYTALVDGAATLSYTDASAFLADKTLFGLHHAATGTATFGRFEVWPL